MYAAWTSHLPTEQKDAFKRQVASAGPVLDRLKGMIEEEVTSMDKVDMSEKAFTNPNWAYLQAYNNGRRAGLNHLNTIIDLDQQRITT